MVEGTTEVAKGAPNDAGRPGAWLWLMLGLAALAALAVALVPGKAIDFLDYYVSAHNLRSGAAPMYGPTSGTGFAGGIYRYPPVFIYLFLPLSYLPFRLAIALWAAGKVVLAGTFLGIFSRRWRLPSLWRFLPGVLLLLPYAIQEMRYGNAQLYIVGLVIAAYLEPERRAARAGLWLGLAAATKVWPLFFFPFLLVQRRFRFLGAACASGIGFTLLPALWLGPGRMWGLLRAWLAQERTLSQLSATAGELWYPGQSLHDVLRRYLSFVDYSVLADPHYRQVAWMRLAPATVERLWLGLALALVAGICVWLLRVPDRDAGTALLFCGLCVIEPHVHRLILETLLWPTLAACVWWTRGRLSRFAQVLFWCAVAASVVGPLVPGSAHQRLLQVYGLDFWAVLLPLSTLIAYTGWQRKSWPLYPETDCNVSKEISQEKKFRK